MRPRFTRDQERVIHTLEGSVAVAAGAGSGKTTVLAHRFAEALGAPVRGAVVPVDGILTITFTAKAAGEIAERVRRVVTAEVSAEAGREVDRAWISTIHALCSRLLRRHLLESGVNPAFRLADDATAQALSAEAYEAAVLRLIERDDSAAELVDSFGVTTLRSMVTSCHDQIRAMGLRPEDVTIGWDIQALHALRLEVLEGVEAYAQALGEAKQTPAVVRASEYLGWWSAQLHACDLDTDDGMKQLCTVCGDYKLTAAGGTKDLGDELKLRRQRLKAAALALASAEVIDAVRALVAGYAIEFRELKARRGALDFDDLQERAVALLEADLDLAERYRSQFGLVMVDEFQDTNELQMRALRPLVDGNLCVVGDERQSIYGWRYADVSIFRRLAKAADSPIPLSVNFRSHPAVLSFVNELFSMPHLFGAEFMRLESCRPAQPTFPLSEEDPRVECVLVDCASSVKVEDAVAVEAAALAVRARELVEVGVKPGDIAVLVRSGTHASAYAKAMEDEGLSVALTAGSALFDTPEVAHVMAMLRAIAVPADDQALLALLAGPMVGVSDDALLALRHAAGTSALWEGVKAVAEGAAGGFDEADRDAILRCREVIDYFGVRYGSLSLGDVVRNACEAFDFDITLSTRGPEGSRAWGNVLKIARAAEAFEAGGAKDPARFVEHLALCQEHSKQNPAPSETGGESVRVMTIHASKGLEFPVVFVADLRARKHRGPDSVLVEAVDVDSVRVPRIAVRMPDGVFEKACTPEYARMSQEAIQAEAEEEKRALYVACTRAKELLVLSATLKGRKAPSEGGTLIDWVREGLKEEEAAVTTVGDATVRMSLIEAVPREETESEMPLRGSLEGPLVDGRFVPPHTAPAMQLPNAVSYSALHLYETCPLSFHARYALHMRGFDASESGRATDVGSAAHARLQAWASGENWSRDRQESLVRRFALDQPEAERVESAAQRFTSTTLAQRVIAAEGRQAEVPFRVALHGTVLNGAIDLLAWEGSHALIVDYKTGRAPEPGDERLGGYELQARCYALAALEGGAETAEVHFVFVEHDVEPVTFCYEGGEAPKIRGELDAIVEHIATRTPSHLEGYDARVCSACPAYGTICPIEGPASRRTAPRR